MSKMVLEAGLMIFPPDRLKTSPDLLMDYPRTRFKSIESNSTDIDRWIR